MEAGENPPVGLILCTEEGVAEAPYALDVRPIKFSLPIIRWYFQTNG
jgi:hypothetical protein